MRRGSLKTGGLARAIVAAVVIVIGSLAGSGAAASAAVTPLGFVMPDNADIAIDGTDVFWTVQSDRRDRAKHRWIFETLLMRGSLLNKSVVQVAAFNDEGDEVPESLAAGGGFLYVNFNNQDSLSNGDFDNSVKVVRMLRDGSNRQTVAQIDAGHAGDFVMEHGVPRLNDCARSVTATSVSYTGEAVISQKTSDRDSKHCGRKKNADHWRYYEVTTGGAMREITREDSPVTSKFTVRHGKVTGVRWGPVRPPIADPWVYYGKAVYQRFHDGEFFVKDLASGAVTGPFQTKLTGHDVYGYGQVNSLGQLATSTYSTTGNRKHEKYHGVSGIFRTPGDAASFAAMKGSAGLQFCGDHLIAINNRGARELDPATFWLQRTLATGHEIEGDNTFIEGCTDKYLYFRRYGPTSKVLLAYPLG